MNSQDSRSDPEIPILIGIPQEPTHVPMQRPTSPVSDAELPVTETTIHEQSRLKRNSKPPKYLEDYVRY